MYKYICPRCNYSVNHLGHYKYHLNKKTICEGTACLVEEYKKYDINLEERLKIMFSDKQTKKSEEPHNVNNNNNYYNSVVHNTTNNNTNNITVNIVSYEKSRGITEEAITDIINDIVIYNQQLINNDYSTDGEYMVAFMTKAIENKVNKDKNVLFNKSGRNNYVVFKTDEGNKKTTLNDGVAKLCNDIEEDYKKTMKPQRFLPDANDDDIVSETKRTRYLIDKEIRRPIERRDEYHSSVVKHFKK